MYSIDSQDTIISLTDVPQSDVGAPLPMVVSDEFHLLLAYIVATPPSGWDGTTVKILSPKTTGETIAIVAFDRPYCHTFGPPNDEVFTGHPLARRGLEPYSANEVGHSSWIRQLERMNAVHPYHAPERFLAGKRHFVFAFHDSTFECIAQDYTITIMIGSMSEAFMQMAKMAIDSDNRNE